MDTLVQLMENHRGRDKVMRTISYVSGLIAAQKPSSGLAKRLIKLSGLISSTRAVLRLFDGPSMLQWSVQYGKGRTDEHLWFRLLQILENLIYCVYYPVEHVAVLSNHGVISQRSNRWATASIILWAFGLTSSILRNLFVYNQLEKSKGCMLKQQRGMNETSERMPATEDVKRIKYQQHELLLSIIKDSCDFCNAVHWLPDGTFLWSGRLSNGQSAFFGTVSSLVGLYQLLTAQNKS